MLTRNSVSDRQHQVFQQNHLPAAYLYDDEKESISGRAQLYQQHRSLAKSDRWLRFLMSDHLIARGISNYGQNNYQWNYHRPNGSFNGACDFRRKRFTAIVIGEADSAQTRSRRQIHLRTQPPVTPGRRSADSGRDHQHQPSATSNYLANRSRRHV